MVSQNKHTQPREQCSDARVGLAQARSSYVPMKQHHVYSQLFNYQPNTCTATSMWLFCKTLISELRIHVGCRWGTTTVVSSYCTTIWWICNVKLCLKVPMQQASVHYIPLTPHLKSCTWPHAHVSLLHHVGYILAISIIDGCMLVSSRQ